MRRNDQDDYHRSKGAPRQVINNFILACVVNTAGSVGCLVLKHLEI